MYLKETAAVAPWGMYAENGDAVSRGMKLLVLKTCSLLTAM